MIPSRRISLALGAACLSLMAFASWAHAAAPATVTVRVVGAAPNFPTLLPLTQVLTTTAPVVKDGGTCTGTSAAGALEEATKGNWEGTWNSGFGDYEVVSIEGQSYPFDASSNKNYYWSFWLNSRESTIGVCGSQLETGNQVLFIPGCFGSECPAAPNVLAVEAPSVAAIGSSVTVRVLSYPGTGGEPTPATGAIVSSEGISQTTDPNGLTTLAFTHAGDYTLHVTGAGEGPPSVPGEAIVCVHADNDGACGTTGPTGSAGGSSSGGVLGYSASSYKGPYAVVAKVAGLIEHHHYARARAPKVLSGTVLAHTTVASVSLRLRRSYRGRCYAYNGASERFGSARCGQGGFFKVGTRSSFSYLLPEALAPGRYVLDVQADDVAGNRTTLARGTSRVVFYVG